MSTVKPSSIEQRLDSVAMSETDRWIARESLRNGELLADRICRAGAGVRCAGALLGGILARLASRLAGRRSVGRS